METSLEIRESAREIKWVNFFHLVVINIFLWTIVWIGDSTTEVFLVTAAMLLMIFYGHWRSYLAVDESGITYRNWKGTRRFLWLDAVFGTVTWKKHLDDFASSRSGPFVTNVTLVLFGKNREELLRVVLDFGTEEKRLAFRDMMAQRLGVAPVERDERRLKLFYDDVRDTPSDTNSGRASGSPLR